MCQSKQAILSNGYRQNSSAGGLGLNIMPMIHIKHLSPRNTMFKHFSTTQVVVKF
jgi:hypothetical protein